jgi:hypothetical protein
MRHHLECNCFMEVQEFEVSKYIWISPFENQPKNKSKIDEWNYCNDTFVWRNK